MTVEHRVIVYSSRQCPHCERAKAILQEQGIAFDERLIDSDEQHRQDLMALLPDVRNLPQLFIDGVSIGSTEDLQQLVQRGEMESIL